MCSICQEEDIIIDPVSTTCEYMHQFCFECILKHVEKKEIKNCPTCRGGSNEILILKQTQPVQQTQPILQPNNFYSTNYFKKNCELLSKITKMTLTNSCLVSDRILYVYVINKNQIELYNRILDAFPNDYDKDTLFKMIKWSYDKRQDQNGQGQNSQNGQNFFFSAEIPGSPGTVFTGNDARDMINSLFGPSTATAATSLFGPGLFGSNNSTGSSGLFGSGFNRPQ